MSKPSSKAPATGFPEFAVRREAFDRYFDRPLPSSTFHDLVNKGKIVPMKSLRGFYLLNDSLRRLGLREVPALPESRKRSNEDVLRLAFTMIDPDIFPAPPWMLFDELVDVQVVDHARLHAEKHQANIENLQSVQEKLAYFAGVLEAQAMMDAGVSNMAES